MRARAGIYDAAGRALLPQRYASSVKAEAVEVTSVLIPM
jgi:hypothetical protein